jgi:UDP-N-acetylmuramoyl-tripeptide--D-alanyl-D-alanine ligase
MMQLSQAAFTLGIVRQGDNVTFASVGTDSRTVRAGELFVALRGERFDGHEYLAQAQAAGAVAAMVDETGATLAPASLPLLMVNNTRSALTQLAHAWRSQFTLPMVALTGSSGKTTVKEMLASILRAACAEPVSTELAQSTVLATRGNLNNDIGVPLTLLGLRAHHRYAVIELGMNHAGEIFHLSKLTRPDVALIVNAGRAHIEFLGSEEAIARAKGEIFEGLSATGAAVVNVDSRHASLWRDLAGARARVEFGLESSAQVSAAFKLRSLDSEIVIKTPRGTVTSRINVPGRHNIVNALAASATAYALNVPEGAIASGLARYSGIKGRLQRSAGYADATLIDDTYNANPESVRAAIDVLATVGGRTYVALGDMGELGAIAPQCHAEIGEYARAAGVERLFAIGENANHAVAAFGAGARHFARIEDMLAEIKSALAPDVTLLVKGSRFMHMERVIKACVREKESTCY